MKLYFILFGLLLVDSCYWANAVSGSRHTDDDDTVEQRIENLETSLEDLGAVEQRIENLETSLENLGAVEQRIENLETNLEDLDGVEQQIENLETSLENFEKKVENQLQYGGKRYQTVSYNGKLLMVAIVNY